MSKSSAAYSRLLSIFHSKETRLDTFYILALVPLLLIAFFNIHYLSPLLFGFILLLLKKSNLYNYSEPTHTQRNFGLILTLSSIIAYYALFQLIPEIGFYGAAIYIAYVLGLFLIFFNFSALREAFTPTFIIALATSISYISFWLELSFSYFLIPLFTSLVGMGSNALGVKVTVQYPDLITLYALRGTIPLQIIWGCIGVYGALVFSILVIVVLSEEPASLKTKMLWAVFGIIGILVLNVFRVVIVLSIAYYYDFNMAELTVHPYLGYAIFLTWLILFLAIFSKRQVILTQFKSIPHRLHNTL